MKKSKKLINIVIVTVFMFSLALSAAAQTQSIQPLWTNTNSVVLGISYSGTSATCTVVITGMSGTTQINNCNVYLKNASGTTIASWTGNSATGDTLRFSKTASGVSSGNTYTLSFTATVHRNGTSENISGSTSKRY